MVRLGIFIFLASVHHCLLSVHMPMVGRGLSLDGEQPHGCLCGLLGEGLTAPWQPVAWTMRDTMLDAHQTHFLFPLVIQKAFPTSFKKKSLLTEVRWDFGMEFWPPECGWKWLAFQGWPYNPLFQKPPQFLSSSFSS